MSSKGWTLIELVFIITVMTILTLTAMPLVSTAIKRHREHQLREALAEIRAAITEFRRDTVVMPCPGEPGTFDGVERQPPFLDPRSKVVISDCSILTADNPDRYPPTLEILVQGVSVAQRARPPARLGGISSSTTDNPMQGKTKIYLRSIPIDPMTGRADWDLRSSFDSPQATSWGGENVFDVRSKSQDTALNGEKYRDW